jgi:hypothetical protein
MLGENAAFCATQSSEGKSGTGFDTGYTEQHCRNNRYNMHGPNTLVALQTLRFGHSCLLFLELKIDKGIRIKRSIQSGHQQQARGENWTRDRLTLKQILVVFLIEEQIHGNDDGAQDRYKNQHRAEIRIPPKINQIANHIDGLLQCC